MAEALVLKFAIDEKTYLQASFKLVKRMGVLKGILSVLIAISIIIAVSAYSGAKVFTTDWSWTTMLYIGPIMLFLLSFPLRMYYRFRKGYRDNKDRFNNVIYSITDEGVENIMVNGSSKSNWDGLKYFLNSEEFIFLFYNEKQAFMFPKNVIGQSQQQQLLDIFRKNNLPEAEK